MSGLNKKIFIGVLIALFTVFVSAYIIVSIVFRPPDIDQMNRSFQINREEILLVTEFLLNSEYDNSAIFIRIRPDELNANETIEMQIGLERGTIYDTRVSDAIFHLSQYGYMSIHMEKDEGVAFLQWTHFEQGRGIAYLPNGRIHDGTGLLPFMIELEPLDEDGWYYYVEWFSRWRSERNRR